MRQLLIVSDNPFSGIAVAFCVTVMLFLSVSCQTESKEYVSSFMQRETVAGMNTDSVTTLISDSGRIRYRVVTSVWKVFDKAPEPYWYFPEKIHFERFDDSLRVESVIDCDTARYFSRRKLWELKKNVHIVNLDGDSFETSLMYWDQRQARVYSDSFIRIKKKDVILSGIGFESNQNLTKYTIFNPNGPFYLDSEEPDSLMMDPKQAK